MPPQATILESAVELSELTRNAGIVFRLFGSCAVFLKCTPRFAILEKNKRVIKDIDAVVSRRSLYDLRKLMLNQGWRELIELTALSFWT
jgi:hypothetical protein